MKVSAVGLALLASAVLLAPAAPAQLDIAPFSDVVVFGDSLSDNGNLFALTGQPPAPYFHGRFSNGLVWVDQLAVAMGKDGHTNFAMGGATTSDVFAQQVMPFVVDAPGAARPDALYVVWAGANDLIGVLQGSSEATATIQNAMTQIALSVEALAVVGAEVVMVPNLPDLGRTPRVLASGPAAAAAARQLTLAYNAALAQTIAALRATRHVDIVELDVFSTMEDIVAHPSHYGLINVSSPAFDPTTGMVVPDPDSYLFWDDIHPTRAGHAAMMAAARRAIVLRVRPTAARLR